MATFSSSPLLLLRCNTFITTLPNPGAGSMFTCTFLVVVYRLSYRWWGFSLLVILTFVLAPPAPQSLFCHKSHPPLHPWWWYPYSDPPQVPGNPYCRLTFSTSPIVRVRCAVTCLCRVTGKFYCALHPRGRVPIKSLHTSSLTMDLDENNPPPKKSPEKLFTFLKSTMFMELTGKKLKSFNGHFLRKLKF